MSDPLVRRAQTILRAIDDYRSRAMPRYRRDGRCIAIDRRGATSCSTIPAAAGRSRDGDMPQVARARHALSAALPRRRASGIEILRVQHARAGLARSSYETPPACSADRSTPRIAGTAASASPRSRALGLDEVWWLVSPGNPLKPAAGMAPLAARLASARGDGAPRADPADRDRAAARHALHRRYARQARPPLPRSALHLADGRRTIWRSSTVARLAADRADGADCRYRPSGL